MFTEKINRLLKKLKIQSKDLAEYASCNPSTLSRMRTGRLIPKSTSITGNKLIHGLLALTKAQEKTEPMLAFLEEEGMATDEASLKNALKNWLFSESAPETDDKTNEPPVSPDERTPFSHFGKKLGDAMQLAELSNAKLGQMINIDPSYLSRFRSGQRTPKSNPGIVLQICQALLDHFEAYGKTDELAELIQAPADALTDSSLLFVCFQKWLCDLEQNDNPALEQLLNNMDSFTPRPSHTLLPVSAIITDAVLQDDISFYHGKEGLQTAVIRFLAAAIKSQAKECYLYSDLGTDWMTTPPSFRVKWLSLMSECIKHGMHIKIIHHIDNNVSELVEVIKNWMPLYMSGMVEPYYCTAPTGSRFQHALFFCPDTACIEGFHATGCTNGLYHFLTGEEQLQSCGDTFEHLFKQSKFLVRMQLGKPLEKSIKALSTDRYHNISITIHQSSVVVSRMKPPYISFIFLHPLMYRAFKLLVEEQNNSGPAVEH